jgi:hypothetical protein
VTVSRDRLHEHTARGRAADFSIDSLRSDLNAAVDHYGKFNNQRTAKRYDTIILEKILTIPFCRTRGRYTGTVQSVLFKSMVVPNWDIIMTICSIHFRSLRHI